ncbi:hypothetical protein BJX64DRAFT_284904 [Aspergillus heterothallicus]
MLDDKHLPIARSSIPETDHNTYILGEIGGHNVVMACLPSGVYGHTSAAIVAQQMLSTFPSIRQGFGLMVGIGGGAPNAVGVDIRLGDIVVSKPTDRFPGVVQYDFGKTLADGVFHRTGTLNKPPEALLTAISRMQASSIVAREGIIEKHMQEAACRYPHMKQFFAYPGSDKDRLFAPSSGEEQEEIVRPPRVSSTPHIHYGLVASANQVMKDARTRDRLTKEMGILCFEMEAVGLVDHFPCLVIRGICDYSDSHKNKEWQNYAAAVAAAYAKELLLTYASKSTDSRKLQHEGIQTRVPVPKTAFMGRTDEVHQMQECFDSSGSRRSLVVWGLSGSGKTQLALHYITLYRDMYRSVLWIDSSSTAKIYASMERLGAQLQVDRQERSVVELVIEWLEKETSWIMVFDGVPGAYDVDDHEDFDIRRYFPACGHGHIVLVTTSSDLHVRLGLPDVQLQGLEERTGSEILLRCAGVSAPEHAGRLRAMAISRKLGGLPLALEQAGAFLSYGTVRMSDFNRQFEARFLDRTLKTPLKKYVGSYEKGCTLWTVFEMLYEVLCQRSPDAIKLLHLAIFTSPWSQTFRYIIGGELTPNDSDYNMTSAIPTVPSVLSETQPYGLMLWIRELRSDTDQLARAIQELVTSGIVKFNRSSSDAVVESCAVHALVRAFVRSKAPEEDLRESIATAFFLHGQVLASEIDPRPLSTLWTHTGDLNRILKDFLSSIPPEMLEPPDGKYFAICGMVVPVYARICRFLGDLERAKSLWEIALKYHFISEGAAWPKSHLHMHEVLEAADVDVKLGSFETAIQKYELFLAHYDRLFEEEDDDNLAVRVSVSLRDARDLSRRRETNLEHAAVALRSSKRIPADTEESSTLGDTALEQQLLLEFNEAIPEKDPQLLAEQAGRLASYYQDHERHEAERQYREIIWHLEVTRLPTTASTSLLDALTKLIACYVKTGTANSEQLRGSLVGASKWASEHGHFEVCDLLLCFEETDIIQACEDNQHYVLEIMFSRHCATALISWALEEKDQRLHDLAARFLGVHGIEKKCIDTLIYQKGTVNRLQYLLEKGLKISFLDFHAILQARSIELKDIGFFKSRKPDGHNGGLSTAHEGGMDNLYEVDVKLKLLINARDDIDAMYYGDNALHISSDRGDFYSTSSRGYFNIATLLLDAGADIEAIDRGGNTPLRIAAKHDKTVVVDLLLERGADAYTQNTAVAMYRSVYSRLSNRLARGS